MPFSAQNVSKIYSTSEYNFKYVVHCILYFMHYSDASALTHTEENDFIMRKKKSLDVVEMFI